MIYTQLQPGSICSGFVSTRVHVYPRHTMLTSHSRVNATEARTPQAVMDAIWGERCPESHAGASQSPNGRPKVIE